MNDFGIVYKLTFPNEKVYIGITTEGLEKRIRRHISYARSGKDYLISRAIRKFGEISFKSEVIFNGTYEQIKKAEIKFIAFFNSYGDGGYNMTCGGEGSLGVPVKQEVRNKISDSLKGRKVSDETRIRMQAAQKGKVISDETKEKMKKAHSTRNPMSQEQKNKIRIALLGKPQTQERINKRVNVRIANNSY